MLLAMENDTILKRNAPVGGLADRVGFAVGVQDMIAEALAGYVFGPLLGEKPQQPDPKEIVAIRNRHMAEWNARVLRATMDAFGSMTTARGNAGERVLTA